MTLLTGFHTPKELEMREATETASSASFVDIYLKFYTNGQVFTRSMTRETTSIFSIINVLHLDNSNIPTTPANEVYSTSKQLIGNRGQAWRSNFN
jgi:hypothetical protein